MKKIILFFFFSFFISSVGAEKHALIIAIGDYPISYNGYRPAGSWRDLSSNNDVEIIKKVLLDQKFIDKNIRIIEDKQATKEGIVNELTALRKRVKAGDVVMVHYSGHGQQIWDAEIDSDENDGYDEALVPYDAFPLFEEGRYQGESHLRDDEFGELLNGIRKKINKSGQLFVLLDCCHSATASRGEIGDEVVRGGVGPLQPAEYTPTGYEKNVGSGMVQDEKEKKNLAPMILVSGAKAEEQNFEYRGYGSLSFAFCRAMNKLGTDMTYRQLFSSIEAQMAIIAPRQHPTLEGAPDLKLFKNEYVKQQPFFKVSKVDNDILTIVGGTLNGIHEGTTFKIVNAGARNLESAKVQTTGTVTNATILESVLKLDEELYGQPKEYWAFVDKKSFGDMNISIQFDKSFSAEYFKKGIRKYLSDNKLGTIVNNAKDADVVLAQKNQDIIFQEPKTFQAIGSAIPFRDTTSLEQIIDPIFNYAQGKYLSALDFKDADYEFELGLVPIDYDKTKREILKIHKDYKPPTGGMRVRAGKDAMIVRITNKGKKDLYFSIVEINSKGELVPSMPSKSCPLNDDQRLVKAGSTLYFTDCVYRFGPPYEKLILKAFGTPTPINLRQTVVSRGESNEHNNVIEKFFQNTYVRTRASIVEQPVEPSKAYTTELVYEIVKDE